MDWATANKPKVSYATSFGVEVYEGDAALKAKVGYFLKRFQAVSVREASGVGILKRDFGINGACVLDPVFLCDRRYYEDMARLGRMRLPQNAYLGGYILDPSEEKAELFDRICGMNKLGEISVISDGVAGERSVSSFWDKTILKNSLVEEWLANVWYSDVFITDSFHGACFALIFEKDFWIVTNESSWRGGDRLRNLVNMLGIGDRLILEGTDLNAVDFGNHIDYTKINRILDAKRKESKQWLEKALKLRETFSGSYDTYDILGERIDSNMVSLQRIEGRIVDDEKRFENGLRDSTAQLQRIVKEGIDRNQEIGRESARQLQILLEGELAKGREAESVLRQQLQKLLEEELAKNQEVGWRLEQALREKSELEQQIAIMYQSNSWQITWPLRKIRAVFRRLLGIIKNVFKHRERSS